jgi:diguanylate cyclase (GGDEF)-like protein
MDTDTPTLLLVDDDANIRMLASHGLKRAGYQVREARNGAEALELFDALQPDLMLIDVAMPVLNGFDTVTAIRRRPDGAMIPLVMLTGSDDHESVTQAFEVGATDFIIKPINLPLLVQRVRYALAGAEREQRLQRIHLEQQSACKLAKLGFWRLNVLTGELQWSAEAETLLGRSEPMPQTVAELLAEIPTDQRSRSERGFAQALDQHQGIDMELSLRRAGQKHIIKLQSSLQAGQDVMVGAFQDITALRAFEDQALYLVEHDELTGLPNLRLFRRLLADQLARSRGGVNTAVVVVDIDRLERINHAFGPHQGDEVVLTMAQRLKQALPPDSLLCRLESDAFALAVNLEAIDLSVIHVHLYSRVSQPMVLNGREMFIDCSMGAAVYPSDATDATALVQAAQAAERQASKQPATALMHFADMQPQQRDGQIILENDLRCALDKQEFFLLYQPQKHLATDRIVGVEALLRWRHTERGIVSPAEFIPVLEATGLIHAVGDWILQEAIRQGAEWQQQGWNLRVAVNLAAAQVENPQLAGRVNEWITHYGLPVELLELEITESTAMQTPEQTILHLQKLRECGLRIAIDDFGTGYSSLAYLAQFPLDTLKIDRAFVKDITLGRQNRAIVTALSALSRHLGLTTIAEGVETERQRDYLDALDIDEVQGFLFSKPLHSKDVIEFLQQHNSTP